MKKILLYNTLSRQKEEFVPIKAGEVGLYTCGPTVYNYAHIGNLRAYLFEDFLQRTLEYNGYRVKRVMNVTDVGHLNGDMDMGEDKMEKGAAREGLSAWEIAARYEEAFKKDLESLNIKAPADYCRVTDNIPEQIALIAKLEEKGYTYRTSDGLYFDTSLVKEYNKLSHLPLEELRAGARVEFNPEKRNATDFALWKFSPAGSKRQMEWPSPWGVGFPGWHIECSAISLKYLGDQLDIHCGGIDHINIHHTNEIAQSEAATGRPFFNYWLHGAFLNIKGGKKMAKSTGDFLTLQKALLERGLDPLAYRFAALQVHYRKPMEYSAEALVQAASGLKSLQAQVAKLGAESGAIDASFQKNFLAAINDDLNMPQALAAVSQVLKSAISAADKRATILDFDRVLGLRLETAANDSASLIDFPPEIKALIEQREQARQEKDWPEADRCRAALFAAGYLVEDGPAGMKINRR